MILIGVERMGIPEIEKEVAGERSAIILEIDMSMEAKTKIGFLDIGKGAAGEMGIATLEPMTKVEKKGIQDLKHDKSEKVNIKAVQ